MQISAFIPCYNNESTIATAIESIQSQTTIIDDFFIIDDCSTDNSLRIIEENNVKVYRMPSNMGRGYVRYMSTKIANHSIILCLDANKSLNPSFVENGIKHFVDNKISAVIGSISYNNTNNYLDRWRNIYLFKSDYNHHELVDCGLITYGTLMRRNAILEVGNYDQSRIHSEDAELSIRLKNNGWRIISDPTLIVHSLSSDSFWKLLERYWRWYAGTNVDVSIKNYLLNIFYSFSYMSRRDLKDKDYKRLLLSIICPHFQFFKNITSKLKLL
ncbi:glycosyltransferase [Opitutales bacterium]|nr:glycosyltransferase [Opitutales bacterium]